MNLHEYQAKQLLIRYSLSTLMGYTCTTPREAEEAASKIGVDLWVTRCRVHTGGRDKAGNMKMINGKKDAHTFAEYWLDRRLVTYQTDTHGQPVNQILVEATTDIGRELYLGAIANRSSCRVAFMAPAEGSVGVEKVAEEIPHPIHKVTLDPLAGPIPYQDRGLAFRLGLEDKQAQQFTKVFVGLATIFLGRDLALVEINPLVVTEQGGLIYLDGKLGVDDNALLCQAGLHEMRDQSQGDPRGARAIQWKLNYIALDGNIGRIVNDAGPAVGIMDIIKLHGDKPTSSPDVGGGTTKGRIIEAFKIILSGDNVKIVLANIFGDTVRCDLVADGVIGAIAGVGVNAPVMVHLGDNNTELGAKKLVDSGLSIITTKSLTGAAQQVATAAERK